MKLKPKVKGPIAGTPAAPPAPKMAASNRKATRRKIAAMRAGVC